MSVTGTVIDGLFTLTMTGEMQMKQTKETIAHRPFCKAFDFVRRDGLYSRSY